MKKLLLLFVGLTFISCEGVDDDIENDFFECTVDFVQFVDDENAIVRFETTLGEETNYFYGRYAYDLDDDDDYAIGDDLVYIRDFQNTANGVATFRFEYGEALGFFCAQVFEELPIHIHQNFDAEADLEILPTDRGVGKWKIKKKSNYSLF
ncbi:MAG: hypothetical protein ACKVJM_06430 [Flavobacteriales bacterium]|nr:hypothetical protein [Flavobacteriaceae bacterium]MDO7599000.1 hypothetical protein [Flavobacteriaceae bacterium]MDO7603469.1 hypothetical protein [Flavobacteriaceae bacterium]|tara:strand:- start:49 stop:501 length:453 start_codon:yes stop_codon:yes gene_type:complete